MPNWCKIVDGKMFAYFVLDGETRQFEMRNEKGCMKNSWHFALFSSTEGDFNKLGKRL